MQTPLTKPLTPTTSQAFSHSGLEGVEILAGLGLSARQARVYLALLRLGVVRARVVARLAGIPRQTVYGSLLELQHLGLVKQSLSVPVNYIALPFSEAVKMLLEQRTQELALISQKAEHLADKIDQPINFAITEAPKPCFGEVCEGERGKKYRMAIQEAQYSIDILVNWARFKQLCYHYQNEIITALKSGVKIGILTEKPMNHSLPKWVNPTRQKYPNFKLKILPAPPEAAIMIFDGAQLALAFNPNVRLTKGPDLWTSHPSLLATYRAFFISAWNKTENYPLR